MIWTDFQRKDPTVEKVDSASIFAFFMSSSITDFDMIMDYRALSKSKSINVVASPEEQTLEVSCAMIGAKIVIEPKDDGCIVQARIASPTLAVDVPFEFDIFGGIKHVDHQLDSASRDPQVLIWHIAQSRIPRMEVNYSMRKILVLEQPNGIPPQTNLAYQEVCPLEIEANKTWQLLSFTRFSLGNLPFRVKTAPVYVGCQIEIRVISENPDPVLDEFAANMVYVTVSIQNSKDEMIHALLKNNSISYLSPLETVGKPVLIQSSGYKEIVVGVRVLCPGADTTDHSLESLITERLRVKDQWTDFSSMFGVTNHPKQAIQPRWEIETEDPTCHLELEFQDRQLLGYYDSLLSIYENGEEYIFPAGAESTHLMQKGQTWTYTSCANRVVLRPSRCVWGAFEQPTDRDEILTRPCADVIKGRFRQLCLSAAPKCNAPVMKSVIVVPEGPVWALNRLHFRYGKQPRPFLFELRRPEGSLKQIHVRLDELRARRYGYDPKLGYSHTMRGKIFLDGVELPDVAWHPQIDESNYYLFPGKDVVLITSDILFEGSGPDFFTIAYRTWVPNSPTVALPTSEPSPFPTVATSAPTTYVSPPPTSMPTRRGVPVTPYVPQSTSIPTMPYLSPTGDPTLMGTSGAPSMLTIAPVQSGEEETSKQRSGETSLSLPAMQEIAAIVVPLVVLFVVVAMFIKNHQATRSGFTRVATYVGEKVSFPDLKSRLLGAKELEMGGV